MAIAATRRAVSRGCSRNAYAFSMRTGIVILDEPGKLFLGLLLGDRFRIDLALLDEPCAELWFLVIQTVSQNIGWGMR